MKRFFCTICQRVKRVHRLPDTDIEHDGAVIGQCRWHTYQGGLSHRAFLGRDGVSGPSLQQFKSRRRA